MNWYLQALKNYVGFEGRSRRSEYWYFALFNTLIALVLAGLGSQWSFFFALYGVYGLGVFIPGLAVTVRRLHDTGKSGYWFFIILVPLIGALVLLYFMVQPSQSNKNDYGAVPK